ncbi:hypothetical protein PQ465_13660 [Sphingobacterium oryzagri]|uniref:Uncharacterized protein n=1 Tax=Sphingobacterium oryzagri TaxID=3025669 RepID=A0ABY7WCY3_9SPHI|nr:hypothetical protein [Sphingobacterium sp. KACC 22765]WDF67352.1 hypothetical protein PQ465_13660 [Sphingobacterium sp. KACC 22765]
MGWFTVFNKKEMPAAASEPQHALTPVVAEPKVDHAQLNGASVHDSQGIFLIYSYLQQDFEQRGYNDALISPDEGYKNDNIRLIKYDLEILIHQVKTYHESLMKDMEFHIHSRGRAGLIDLVDELRIKQTDLQAHMTKVQEFEQSLASDRGLCERAVLAYKRGFMKGLASITQAYLLTRKF